MITDSILGLELIEYERLADLKVDEIMQTDIPTIKTSHRFQRGLDLLIDHTFLLCDRRRWYICRYFDEKGYFKTV